MIYPTIEAVNAASHEQICRWWRFLPSPGMSAVDRSPEEVNGAIEAEGLIQARIAKRLEEFGGFTPEISKRIGWDKIH